MESKNNKNIRIIPKLDIKGPNLIKGINFEGLRVLGKPEDFALKYYKDGADEIIYIDVVASLYGRNNLLEIVEKTAKNIFIPLTAGGGIRTIEDIRALLRAGADKVAINTAAIKNPQLISQASKVFGSQCIVVSIEAKKNEDGSYECYIDNGRERTGVDVFEWAQRVVKLGAGEILITSIDRDGTGKGYDINLVKKVTELVSIPVIACGGAGRKEHIEQVIKEGKVDAVALASLFHYNFSITADPTKYEGEGNIDYLVKNDKINLNGRIIPSDINEVKLFLKEQGIACINHPNAENNNSLDNLINSPLLAIIDYGLGNLFSIKKAFESSGARVVITDNLQKIKTADGLILPGVGTFYDGIKGLEDRGLLEPIKSLIRNGKPIIGICLGMQILMTEGEEFGLHKGLDLIRGKVICMAQPEELSSQYKIPHVGWNKVDFLKPWHKGEKLAFGNNTKDDYFYFVHSYMVVPDNKDNIVGVTSYGNNIFCSVIKKDNIIGCQFHPEKSGDSGLNFCKNIVNFVNNNKNILAN